MSQQFRLQAAVNTLLLVSIWSSHAQLAGSKTADETMVKDQWGSVWNVNHVATLSVSRKNTPIHSCALKWPAPPTKVNAGKSFGAELGQFVFLTRPAARPCSTVSKWTGSYIHLFTPIPALVSVLNCCLCNTHCDALESNLGLVSCPSRLEQSGWTSSLLIGRWPCTSHTWSFVQSEVGSHSYGAPWPGIEGLLI